MAPQADSAVRNPNRPQFHVCAFACSGRVQCDLPTSVRPPPRRCAASSCCRDRGALICPPHHGAHIFSLGSPRGPAYRITAARHGRSSADGEHAFLVSTSVVVTRREARPRASSLVAIGRMMPNEAAFFFRGVHAGNEPDHRPPPPPPTHIHNTQTLAGRVDGGYSEWRHPGPPSCRQVHSPSHALRRTPHVFAHGFRVTPPVGHLPA